MTLAYFSVNLYMQWEGYGFTFTCTFYVSLLQDGATVLCYASRNNHLEVVKFLLERGAQVNKVQHCKHTA